MIGKLRNCYDEIIIEEYITGIDVTNYLIGNFNNYPINDIVITELNNPSPFAVYGAEEKYNKLRSLYINDEKLEQHICQHIKNTSIQIAQIVGANDICRIDYRYNYDTQKYYFIEINSAPRFSSTSEIGFIAQKKGMPFAQILNMYIKAFNERIDLGC